MRIGGNGCLSKNEKCPILLSSNGKFCVNTCEKNEFIKTGE